MENIINTSKGSSAKNYGYCENDLTDEITETIGWLFENSENLRESTITAYLSLLFHLTSLVQNIEERRYLYGTLLDFENRNKCQIKLHL